MLEIGVAWEGAHEPAGANQMEKSMRRSGRGMFESHGDSREIEKESGESLAAAASCQPTHNVSLEDDVAAACVAHM